MAVSIIYNMCMPVRMKTGKKASAYGIWGVWAYSHVDFGCTGCQYPQVDPHS